MLVPMIRPRFQEERRAGSRTGRAARSRAIAFALPILLLPTVGACAKRAPPVPLEPRHVEAGPVYRPSDDLLSRPDLQRVVDLQVARDGQALAALLFDMDPAVRARAAFALGSVQDSAAVPSLVRLLEQDAVARVRSDAAFALGQTPAEAGVRALVGRLTVEPDTAVLISVVEALGKAGMLDALDTLAVLRMAEPRGDGAEALRAALALAYARFGLRGYHHADAVEWLLEAITADEPAVRQNAAYYFGRSARAEAWAQRRRRLVRALEVYAPDDRAAMHLLPALTRVEDTDDVAPIAAWLNGSSAWPNRVNAARALIRRLELPAARAALLDALSDRSHHVRRAAAETLAGATLDGPERSRALAVLRRPDTAPPVTGALMRALARSGARAEVLRAYDAQASSAARRYALPALASLSDARALDALEHAATDTVAGVAAAAIEALAARRAAADSAPELAVPAGRAFRTLSAGLRRRDLAVTTAAAQALADSAFAPLGAGPLLQSVYLQLSMPADVEPMTAILAALGTLGDSSALPLLREAGASEHRPLRQAAAGALERITGEPVDVAGAGAGPTPPVDWDRLRRWGPRPRLVLETVHGAVVVELSGEQAPQTVAGILALAEAGEYDGVPFHRVVPNFVVQGGDYTRGDGWGGPPWAMRSEFTRIPYLRGTLGMASAGKDTEGSQFFVTHSMQPHLDGRYSAFGTVVEGLDVVDAIAEDDVVVRARVQPTPAPTATTPQ